MSRIVQVVTNIASPEKAEEIAETLVGERLAAGVQIDGPVTSIYRWKGRVQREREWRCTIKTTPERLAELESRLAELHPYEVPKIVATLADSVADSYAKWAAESVGNGGAKQS